jgi:hypothetical protein
MAGNKTKENSTKEKVIQKYIIVICNANLKILI